MSSQGATEATKHVETVGRARSRVKCRGSGGSTTREGFARCVGAGYVRVWPPENLDYPGLREERRCSRDHTAPMVTTAKVPNGHRFALPQKSSVPEQAAIVLMAPNDKNATAPTSVPAN